MPNLYSLNITDGKNSGDQISSTYEGRHLTLEERSLTHPERDSGLVVVGDPVVVGGIVGRAFTSATSERDQIAIDTEGIWAFNVILLGGGEIGDSIFINENTAVLSNDDADGVFFGYLLASYDTVPYDEPQLVPVKIHAHPCLGEDES